jgi:tRNA pseudouridine55 synthase
MAKVSNDQGSFLLVDKPVGFSSFQVVRLMQKMGAKVGHAGTLDPFASGLLILLFNRATRQFDAIQKLDKEYTGEMLLGITTDTYDITGFQCESGKDPTVDLGLKPLNHIAQRFTGDVQQVPPRFSALKRGGRRLYELSRQKRFVVIKPRRVSIKSFHIEQADPPLLTFRAVVGKGVYLRSLVHDFGALIGCGACLLTLRRTRIGMYKVSEASKLGMLIREMSC